MPPTARAFIVIGAIAMLAAVALGAFGAHAPKARLSPDMLAAYRTGVEYQVYHALGLLAAGLAALWMPESRLLRAAGWMMLAGIVLFSGSLYALALTGARALGAITPFGGVAFLLSWALFALAAIRAPRKEGR